MAPDCFSTEADPELGLFGLTLFALWLFVLALALCLDFAGKMLHGIIRRFSLGMVTVAFRCPKTYDDEA
jgi:hypothetical protein